MTKIRRGDVFFAQLDPVVATSTTEFFDKPFSRPAKSTCVGNFALHICPVDGDVSITVTEMASMLKTIEHEIVCGIAPRVPKFYVDENF